MSDRITQKSDGKMFQNRIQNKEMVFYMFHIA